MESHLRPTAGPVLNGIALFEFHLFSDRQARAAVIAEVGTGAGNGLGPGLVDTTSTSGFVVLALGVPVGGLSTVSIGKIGRFFEFFGCVDEWWSVCDDSLLLLRLYAVENSTNAGGFLFIYRHLKSRILRCSER